MTRRRRILAFLGLGIVGVLVLVQTPWARHALLDRIIAFLHDRHGVALRAERLDLRLHALAVTLHGVALASDEAPDQPMARVARLDIDFSARAMLGRLAFDRVTLVRPLVRVDLTDARRSTTGGARLPPDLEIGFLQIEDLGVDATLAGGVRVAAGGVRASGGGTGQAADLTLQLASLAIDAPSARVRYEGVSGRLALRGGDLVTLSVRADSDAAALRIEGTATLSHPGSLDGRYEANIDLAALGQVISGWPRLAGRLDVRGSIGGARSDPVVTFQALGTRLEWSHLRGARLQATGEMDARRLLLSARLDAGDFGSMVARGSVALDSGTPSQLRAEWTAPRVERWAALKDVGLHHLSATGEVDCRWLGLLPTLEALAGEARIRVHGLEASDRPDARLDLTARRGLVAVAVDAALAGGTRASAHVSTELSARAPGASHLAGTVRLESDDLAAAARQLQARGLNMPTVEALPPARVSLSGVVAGTLETPRLDTSVNGTAVVAPFERVVATGLLSLDREGLRVAPLSVETTDGRAELRGTLRFGDLATAGSFEARLDRLDVIARWLSAGWRPEGRASASGRW